MPYVAWGNCRVFLITGTPWKLVGDEFRSKDNYELKSTWLMINNHGLASTSRMRTAISPEKWEPYMDSYFILIRAHQHDTAVGPALYGQSRVQTPHPSLVVWTDTSYKHWGRIPKLRQEGAGEFWQLFSIFFGIIILNTPAPQPGGIS